MSCQFGSAESFDGDRGRLSHLHVADFRFAQRHDELHRGLRSLRTANAELEELELDELDDPDELEPVPAPPSPEVPVAPAPVPEPDPLDELLFEALVVPLADTTSPT